jgi:hypothetical protein
MIKARAANLDRIAIPALSSYTFISYDLDYVSLAVEMHICVSIAF